MNVLTRLEFELTYFEAAVHLFYHYVAGTSSQTDTSRNKLRDKFLFTKTFCYE